MIDIKVKEINILCEPERSKPSPLKALYRTAFGIKRDWFDGSPGLPKPLSFVHIVDARLSLMS